MRKTTAEKILDLMEEIKTGKGLSITVYEGRDIIEANEMEAHVSAFFHAGQLFPIPLAKKYGLDIVSVEKTYDMMKDLNTYYRRCRKKS
jgi:hypothetical protein